MAKSKATLENQKEQALLLAKSGLTFEEISQAIGVSPRTIGRWSLDAVWIEEMADFKRGIYQAIQVELSGGVLRATRRLKELMGSENEMIALGAARALTMMGKHYGLAESPAIDVEVQEGEQRTIDPDTLQHIKEVVYGFPDAPSDRILKSADPTPELTPVE